MRMTFGILVLCISIGSLVISVVCLLIQERESKRVMRKLKSFLKGEEREII